MKLNEGVNALKKNFINSLKNRQDINVGIEYEFHIPIDVDMHINVIESNYETEDNIERLIELVKHHDLYDFRGDIGIALRDSKYAIIIDTADLTQYIKDDELIELEPSDSVIAKFNVLVKIHKELESFDLENLTVDDIAKVKEIATEFIPVYEVGETISGDSLKYLLVSSYDTNDLHEYTIKWNNIESLVDQMWLDTVIGYEEGGDSSGALDSLYTVIEELSKIDNIEPIEIDEYYELNDITDFVEPLRDYLLDNNVINEYLYYNVNLSDFDPTNPEHIKFVEENDLFDMDGEVEFLASEVIPEQLNSERIDYDRVDTDNNYQIEVISNTMTFANATEHMEEMLGFISNNGYTSEHSGMHISISSQKWKNKPFNFLKFFVLMNLPKVLDDFPVRNHVSDLHDKFVSNYQVIEIIKEALDNERNVSVAVSKILKKLEDKSRDIFYGKMQSIKFDDYEQYDGRIELRFFGGKDYEDRYDEMVEHMYKSTYIMDLSYGELLDKEYKKHFVKLLDEIVSRRPQYWFGKEFLGLETFVEVFRKYKEVEKGA